MFYLLMVVSIQEEVGEHHQSIHHVFFYLVVQVASLVVLVDSLVHKKLKDYLVLLRTYMPPIGKHIKELVEHLYSPKLLYWMRIILLPACSKLIRYYNWNLV